MNQVDIDGIFIELDHISVTTSASKTLAPLVFLHEGLGSVSMWRDWPASLCADTGRSGWSYSRLGYGKSSPVMDVRGEPGQDAEGVRTGRLQPDYLHREAFEILPKLLSALKIENPILIGHSDGATIALLHATRYPVGACVVLAPHVIVEDVTIRSIEAARTAYETGPLRERLSRFHDHVDVAFWQWNDVWLSPGFRGFDIRQECRAINAPLLAIQGVDDAYGTMAQIDELLAAVPHGERLELARCGHSPHRDRPEAVNEAIKLFLEHLN